MCSKYLVAYSSWIDCRKALSSCPDGYRKITVTKSFSVYHTYASFSSLERNCDAQLYSIIIILPWYTIQIRLCGSLALNDIGGWSLLKLLFEQVI